MHTDLIRLSHDRNDVQAMLDEKCRDSEWMQTDVIDLFVSHPDARKNQSPDDFTGIMKTMDILGVSDARAFSISWRGGG